MELIFNPHGEFRWSPEGPVSQIHSPHLLVCAPGIFSDLLRFVQMLKREWGAESNGKLPHLFIPSKAAAWVPEFAMEHLPLGRIAALVPEFAVKALPLGQNTDDDDRWCRNFPEFSDSYLTKIDIQWSKLMTMEWINKQSTVQCNFVLKLVTDKALMHGCARVAHCVIARWRNFSHYCRPLRLYDVWVTCSEHREALTAAPTAHGIHKQALTVQGRST